jgi:hypothetical protein
MDHITHITTRLTATFTGLGCRAHTVDADDWCSASLPPAFHYGWLPPIALTPAGNRVAFFSPDLLAMTTAHLDADDRERYLALIELIATVAGDAPPSTSPIQVLRFVEDHLPDTTRAPDLLLASEIELRARDLGLVPAAQRQPVPVPEERAGSLHANLTDPTFATACHADPTTRDHWLRQHPTGFSPLTDRRACQYHVSGILELTQHLTDDQFLLYVDAIATLLTATALAKTTHEHPLDIYLQDSASEALILVAVALTNHLDTSDAFLSE